MEGLCGWISWRNSAIKTKAGKTASGPTDFAGRDVSNPKVPGWLRQLSQPTWRGKLGADLEAASSCRRRSPRTAVTTSSAAAPG
jgi:hypothetical protein